MEITLLIKSIIGLVAFLAILIFFLLYSSNEKKKKILKEKSRVIKKREIHDLESLRGIIKNHQTTEEELKKALSLVLEYHGKIYKKEGGKVHPDFTIYLDIIVAICLHPNTSKDIILNFDRDLEARNPEYKKEINAALTEGLNLRGR